MGGDPISAGGVPAQPPAPEKDDVMLTCDGCGQSFPSDGLYAHVHGGCPCDEDYSNGIPKLTVGADSEEA